MSFSNTEDTIKAYCQSTNTIPDPVGWSRRRWTVVTGSPFRYDFAGIACLWAMQLTPLMVHCKELLSQFCQLNSEECYPQTKCSFQFWWNVLLWLYSNIPSGVPFSAHLEQSFSLRTNWATFLWALCLLSITVSFHINWLQRFQVIKKPRFIINFIYTFDHMRSLVSEANKLNSF